MTLTLYDWWLDVATLKENGENSFEISIFNKENYIGYRIIGEKYDNEWEFFSEGFDEEDMNTYENVNLWGSSLETELRKLNII